MAHRTPRRSLTGPGVALLAFPWVFSQPYPRDVMIRIFLYALLAQAWNLLGGYCGQISLGSAVFFGIGAYTSSVLSLWWGVSPWLGMLAGMALAVLVSQAIGYPCFRLRGHYFAIATIGIGEIVQTIAINWDAIGGARGIWLPIKPETLVQLPVPPRQVGLLLHRARPPRSPCSASRPSSSARASGTTSGRSARIRTRPRAWASP